MCMAAQTTALASRQQKGYAMTNMPAIPMPAIPMPAILAPAIPVCTQAIPLLGRAVQVRASLTASTDTLLLLEAVGFAVMGVTQLLRLVYPARDDARPYQQDPTTTERHPALPQFLRGLRLFNGEQRFDWLGPAAQCVLYLALSCSLFVAVVEGVSHRHNRSVFLSPIPVQVILILTAQPTTMSSPYPEMAVVTLAFWVAWFMGTA